MHYTSQRIQCKSPNSIQVIKWNRNHQIQSKSPNSICPKIYLKSTKRNLIKDGRIDLPTNTVAYRFKTNDGALYNRIVSVMLVAVVFRIFLMTIHAFLADNRMRIINLVSQHLTRLYGVGMARQGKAVGNISHVACGGLRFFLCGNTISELGEVI